MSDLFKRVKNLIIDDLEFNSTGDTGFDIVFSGEFDDEPEPDIYEITIFNLKKSTIELIKKDSDIILNAGYGNDIGNIFAGKIKEVMTKTQGTDKATIIQAYNTGESWINKAISLTLNGPVDAKKLITEMAILAGIEIGEISLVNNKVYQNGKSVFGRLSAELKKIVKDCESSMIIRNGKIFITDSVTGFETGFVLSAETGLIGRPEKIDSKDSKSEYTVTALLNYKIAPRSKIELISSTISGTFTVVKGVYTTDFNVEMELITFRR